MSARRFFRYIGAMFGFAGPSRERRIEELLDMLGLSAVADKRLGTFSSGMVQKVGLAQAFINELRMLLLDEPTAGLDPIGGIIPRVSILPCIDAAVPVRRSTAG
jgi:ABC-2 type transport system ATP-binding protein